MFKMYRTVHLKLFKVMSFANNSLGEEFREKQFWKTNKK